MSHLPSKSPRMSEMRTRICTEPMFWRLEDWTQMIKNLSSFWHMSYVLKVTFILLNRAPKHKTSDDSNWDILWLWHTFLIPCLECIFDLLWKPLKHGSFLVHPHNWCVNRARGCHSFFKRATWWGSGNKELLRFMLPKQKYSHNLIHVTKIIYTQR